MRAFRRIHLAAAALALLCGALAPALGQQQTPGGKLSQARSALVDSAEAHKSSAEELLRLVTEEADRLSATHEQLKQLYADGIVSKKELEESERRLADARARQENLRRQMADSDRLIAETEQAEKLAKSRPASSNLIRPSIKFNSTAVVIRYTGRTHSAVAGLGGVQAFFWSTFGRQLPLSAVGQSATHDRFGYDHQHAVDVPLHPDSLEGRAVISYLQAQGITFTAFRAAIPGVATGPHIHIGRPSNRLS